MGVMALCDMAVAQSLFLGVTREVTIMPVVRNTRVIIIIFVILPTLGPLLFTRRRVLK